MAFKLGDRNRPTHKGGVKIVTTPLGYGELAEARNDGTIAVSPDVDQSNKKFMNRMIKHEMKHMKDNLNIQKMVIWVEYIIQVVLKMTLI